MAVQLPHWLVHLDRSLTSLFELLHVNGYKPHEMTQFFAASGTLTHEHEAPWRKDEPRLYRALEYLTVGDRGFIGQPPATGVPPDGIVTSAGGRKAGMINLNTVWD